jgi:FG-GAP repeat
MIRRAGEPRGRQGRIRPALGALLAVAAAALGGGSPATAAPPSVGGTLDLAQSGILLAGASQSTPLNASLFQHQDPTDQPRPDDLPASVAFAGDVNGDGISDMAVGAPLADFAGRVRAGTVTIVFGKRPPAASVDLAHLGDQGLVIGGPEKGARAGTSIASLGDVNGDGYGDLLVGAPRTSTPGRGRSAGMAFVVLGGPAAGTIDLAAGQGRTVALPGAAHGDHAGMAVAAVGDLDGDGRAEAVVGAPDADPAGRDRAGSAYVISSGRLLGGGDLQTAGYRIDGPSPFARLGAAVAGTADMDRDGLGEILIGAPGTLDGGPSPPPTSSGAYLVAGRASSGTIDLAAGDARTRVITGSADQGAGFAVADAGDVDGDGTHDILVGAPLTSLPGRLSSGSAYVVRGRTDPAPVSLGDSTRDVVRIDGARANDRLGTSVAGAGDVDGDGRAEVLLGAPGAYALGRWLPGAAYLVAAQSVDLALPGVAALRLAGIDRPNAFAGTSVVGGTDVDGDRRPDVLVGWYPGSAGLVLSPTLPTALPARPRTGSSCTTPATNVEVIIAESLAASDSVTGARAAALEALLVRPRTQPTTIGAVAFGTQALELFAPTTVGPQGFTGPFDLLRALIAERLQQGYGLGDGRRLSAGFAASATANPGRGAQILITDGASARGPDPTAAARRATTASGSVASRSAPADGSSPT